MTPPCLREQDLAVLRGTFKRFPWVSEVRVFGSRATGQAHRASDIDLAVSAPGASTHQWLELVEAIEMAPIIYDLDVLRIENLQNRKLLEKIERESLPIYQADPLPIQGG